MKNTLVQCILFSIFLGIIASASYAERISCNGVNSLSYCVKNSNNIQGNNICVKASNYADAMKQCGNKGTVWQLQNYGLSSFSDAWMCSGSPSKRTLCLQYKATMKLDWRPTSANDGVCYQVVKGTQDDCDGTDYAQKPMDNSQCVKAGGLLNEDANQYLTCYCGSTKKDFDPSKGETCAGQAAAADAPTENQAQAEATESLMACANRVIQEAAACTNKSIETEKACKEYDKENETANGISAMAQTVFAGLQQKGKMDAQTGAGSQATCAAASLAASGTAALLSGFIKQCTAEQTACTTVCSKIRENTIAKACSGVADKNPRLDTVKNEHKAYMAEKQGLLDKELEKADTYCKFTAPKENDLLADVLTNTTKAQAAAQECACTNAVDASGGCGPTAAVCLANPTAPGCADTIQSCTLGALDYSSSICNCLREPNSPSCKITAAASVNGMGSDIKNPGAGNASNFGAAGSSGAGDFNSNMDLSSQRAAGSSDETRKAVALDPHGSPIGGVSSNASGGSGSNGNQPGVAGEEEKSGIGGAFSSLKSMVGSMFGGGNKSAGNGGNGKPSNGGVNFDPNKFKNPKGLRGLAGSGGFGSKNMDIWKMIKTRHVDSDRGGNFFDPSYNPK